MKQLETRSGRKPSQDHDELNQLIGLFNRRGVGSYLEIGARHGDTFFEVMRSLPVGSTGVAVDLAGGPWGTVKSVGALHDAVRELVALGYKASVILGDSAACSTRNLIAARAPFDAAFIDGDHRYDAVKSDYEFVKDRARIVAFHDIAGEGQTTKDKNRYPVEVGTFWQEVKATRDFQEFVSKGSAMGIGVLL